jgi:hypothetical protein
MCCFSQPVEVIANTSIFARGDGGHQFLVYSMSYAASTELAMVLPLPVPPGPADEAVRFINLERYANFFTDMRNGFPREMVYPRSAGLFKSAPEGPPPLVVHDVGSFEASFVPRIDDFTRLDPRFQIPRDVWEQLPVYRDYGFAVFKLKSTGPSPGLFQRLLKAGRAPRPLTVHPMALAFPRRNVDLLYFPTVHIHDRKVHAKAAFDHTLYCQAEPGQEEFLERWDRSYGPASAFLDVSRTAGIIVADQPCRRVTIQGLRENRDTLVGKGEQVPAPSLK